jgi:hypothetical protein
VNNELERMWNEEVIAKCELLFWHLLGATKENHENLSQDSQCLD